MQFRADPFFHLTYCTNIHAGESWPEVRASLDAIGVEARMGTPEEFAAMLDDQARQWKAVIDEIGIKVE